MMRMEAYVVDTAFSGKLNNLCLCSVGRKLKISISELFFVKDSSTGGSNVIEAGEEFVDVADNIISSEVQG